jgi:hypothetical protein
MRTRLKKISIKAKVFIGLIVIALLLLIVLMNKATLNSLIPVDYMRDPWPLGKECEVPAPNK